jgi:ArsR family transcriptional regulator, arsenate/arsenite/antimonite-responsive transcriptional repressor / arsenate reductase (thioredoxin)
MSTAELEARARAHAALGDPHRLAMIDLLAFEDLSPGQLGARLELPTNLAAHHLRVLEEAELITRVRSEGDGRRTYVTRTAACNQLLGATALPRPARVAFVCSANSARSQLAEHYWRTVSDVPVVSAGTHPAGRVHPRAVAVAKRHGLDLSQARPKLRAEVLGGDELVIAVCDRAFEEIDATAWHWSVPDPARSDHTDAFEAAFTEIAARVTRLAHSLS